MARTWHHRPRRIQENDPRSFLNGYVAGVDDGQPIYRARLTSAAGVRKGLQRAAHKRDRANVRLALAIGAEPPRPQRRRVDWDAH